MASTHSSAAPLHGESLHSTAPPTLGTDALLASTTSYTRIGIAPAPTPEEMGRRARKLVLLSLVGLSRGFAPRPDAATLRCDTRASSVAAGDAAAVESMRSARLDAVEDAEDMRKIFEAGADVQLTVEQEMELEDKLEDLGSVFDAEDMKRIFREGAEAEGGAAGLKDDASSLGDLDDASFKMLMWKRLGQNDFDRIFKGPRVEFEIK